MSRERWRVYVLLLMILLSGDMIGLYLSGLDWRTFFLALGAGWGTISLAALLRS